LPRYKVNTTICSLCKWYKSAAVNQASDHGLDNVTDGQNSSLIIDCYVYLLDFTQCFSATDALPHTGKSGIMKVLDSINFVICALNTVIEFRK
jgi:hypothetical protein